MFDSELEDLDIEFEGAEVNYENCDICQECNERYTNFDWCKSCNAKHFKDEFPNWTSDDQDIDDFIQRTQLAAEKNYLALEWVAWGNLTDIEKIGEGGHGSVYKATWIDGPIHTWHFETSTWKRSGHKEVALKSIAFDDNHILILNWMQTFHKLIVQNNSSLPIYGMTRNGETNEYLLVMEYVSNGSLRHNTSRASSEVTWISRLEILRDITDDLAAIHEIGLLHRDLHSGNILQISNNAAYISDPGAYHLVRYRKHEIIGVMPYVAPEVLCGRPHTKASDVYSLGIIMWELVSAQPPFVKTPHDINLANKICRGLRPEPVEGTPAFYQGMMESCWDNDPLRRPTAKELNKALYDLLRFPTSEIRSQLDVAEMIRHEKESQYIQPSKIDPHPLAIYTSRVLPMVVLRANSESESEYEYEDEYKVMMLDEDLLISEDEFVPFDEQVSPTESTFEHLK